MKQSIHESVQLPPRAEIANFQYDASTRGMMRNSLTMPKEEVDALIAEGKLRGNIKCRIMHLHPEL